LQQSYNNKEVLQIFVTEEFKKIELDDKLQFNYAISNLGRLISYTNKFEDGRVVKGSLTEGFRMFRYKIRRNGKINYKHKFIYKLVAEHFLPPPAKEQEYIIHLDHNLSNDNVKNLKWVTREEKLQHQRTNPKVIEAKKQLAEHNRMRDGHKLTSTQVMQIKKRLADPNNKTRMKTLAKRFGISEMQLYRIKTGENWGHIKI